jgi:ATP-binding cassette, subfamily B, multidrug efflux pump
MSTNSVSKLEKKQTVETPRIGPMGRGNPMGMMNIAQKPKNFKKTMSQLGGYIKPFWLSIIIVVVFTMASTMFAIFSPKILGRMTDQVVNDFVHRLAFNYQALGSIALQLLVLFGLSAIFNYLQSWIMTNVSQKISYRFRRDISEKIGRMPLGYFDRTTHGEILSRITNDVETVSQTLNQSMTQIIAAVTMIIGILAMMLSISWQMTLVALVTLPLSFGLIGLVVKRSQRYFKLQQDTLGHLNGHIEEMYGGHNVMKVFNGQARSIAIFSKHNNDLYGSAWRSQFLSGLLFPIINFVGNIGYVGVTVLGGYLAIQGRINIGEIQAFIQYVNQFNQPIIQTANIANILQSTAAAAERVFEFLAEAEELPENDKSKVLSDVRGEVEFEHVRFGYNPDKTIINDFTARINPGQRVAIVGPTGAGKTTMVNLLMRFYEVSSGTIKIDGVDTCTMKRVNVRKLFGMVLQDTWLFNGTIRENLSYGRPEATLEEVKEAAKAAHAHHFIRSLPQGYDMVLDEEANNISQGEKQLLTIARAMLVKTPMLILDEATSSVDTRTEFLIQEAMDRLMRGKTSFVIAHRLSTIKNADLILVMDKGSIVEQGTHEDLLVRNGFYAALYNSQFTGKEIAANRQDASRQKT